MKPDHPTRTFSDFFVTTSQPSSLKVIAEQHPEAGLVFPNYTIELNDPTSFSRPLVFEIALDSAGEIREPEVNYMVCRRSDRCF
jgi:hypothetical protein